MRYMQVSGNYRNPAHCSDDACPCGFPGAEIPQGTGYIYVSKEVADFRSDCLTEPEAKAKIDRLKARMGPNSVVFAGSGVFAPILMCEQGARKRGLDLEVAAEDARHWWRTGQVPLRPTPLAGAKAPEPAVARPPAAPPPPPPMPAIPVSAAAPASGSGMSEASRLVNVFVDPKPAFEDLAARPSWWLPMVLVTLLAVVYVLAFSSHVGWEHFARHQAETSKRMQNMSPEDRERAVQAQVQYGPVMGVVGAAVATPLIIVLTAAVLLFVFTAMYGAKVKFRQALAVSAWASLPRVLATGGFLLVMFLKDPVDFDFQNPAGFNIGFYLDPKAVPAWLLALAESVDVFAVWGILLLAVGMAAVTKKRWTSVLPGVIVPWGVFVILRVGSAAIFG